MQCVGTRSATIIDVVMAMVCLLWFFGSLVLWFFGSLVRWLVGWLVGW
jgi:hypothetical protein